MKLWSGRNIGLAVLMRLRIVFAICNRLTPYNSFFLVSQCGVQQRNGFTDEPKLAEAFCEPAHTGRGRMSENC
jgi:hypothetical protein